MKLEQAIAVVGEDGEVEHYDEDRDRLEFFYVREIRAHGVSPDKVNSYYWKPILNIKNPGLVYES